MAIGTSTGEEYPSKLEEVLGTMDKSANIESSGQNPIDAGRVIRNKSYDQFRDENDLPGAPYQDIRSKTKVAQADPQSADTPGSDMEYKKQTPPTYSGEITDSWNAIAPFRGKMVDPWALSPNDMRDFLNEEKRKQEENFPFREKLPDVPVRPGDSPPPPAKNPRRPMAEDDSIPPNAQPAQFLYTNARSADGDLKLTPEEKNLYDTHLRNLIGPGGVDNEDGSRSTVKSMMVEFDDRTFVLPTVYNGKILDQDEAIAKAKEIGLDKFPSYGSQEEAEKRYDQLHKYMEKDTNDLKEAKGAYNTIVDWLQNNLKTPGQQMQNWSGKEILGYMLSTGLGVLGPGRGSIATGGRPSVTTLLNGRDITLSSEPRSFLPANENVAGKGKADAALEVIQGKYSPEFYRHLAEMESGSPYERALANQKAGRMNPTGDSVEDFIKGSRNTTLRLVDKNPPQEPQGRPVPSLQQRQTQEAQRAANDRNYQLGKGTDRVNVGQGKGVLNDNKEEVMAMIRKGHQPSEIARRFDITSGAVQQWIKRNGPITNIEDILDK